MSVNFSAESARTPRACRMICHAPMLCLFFGWFWVSFCLLFESRQRSGFRNEAVPLANQVHKRMQNGKRKLGLFVKDLVFCFMVTLGLKFTLQDFWFWFD